MKAKAALAARVLLGLVFVVFGLNFFFHFIQQPPMSPAAGAFAGALFQTGYEFQLIKVFEVLCGVLLLAGFFVPLALTILAPIIVNIFFFHAMLEPSGLPLPIVLVLLEVFLAWSYRDAFKPMLAMKVAPTP